MYYNKILSHYSYNILYSFIGLLAYIKLVYLNNKFKLETLDKIIIPIVFVVNANIIPSYLYILIYKLYNNIKEIITQDSCDYILIISSIGIILRISGYYTIYFILIRYYI